MANGDAVAKLVWCTTSRRACCRSMLTRYERPSVLPSCAGLNKADPHELPSSMHMQLEPKPGTNGNLEHTGNREVSHIAKYAVTEAAEEVNPFSEKQMDAMKAALRPKVAQQGQEGQVKQRNRSLWVSITDYIIGADKLQQVKH